jgi:hypothetical protein
MIKKTNQLSWPTHTAPSSFFSCFHLPALRPSKSHAKIEIFVSSKFRLCSLYVRKWEKKTVPFFAVVNKKYNEIRKVITFYYFSYTLFYTINIKT